jgi:hypothetical protein
MTAEIVHALMQTAERAEADLCAKRTLATVAEGEMHARALRIAESVLASGSAPECDVAAFAAIRAEWIAARYAMRAAGNRAADARHANRGDQRYPPVPARDDRFDDRGPDVKRGRFPERSERAGRKRADGEAAGGDGNLAIAETP